MLSLPASLKTPLTRCYQASWVRFNFTLSRPREVRMGGLNVMTWAAIYLFILKSAFRLVDCIYVCYIKELPEKI